MAVPRIPHFEEGPVFIDQFEELEAYLNSQRLVPGPGIDLQRTAGYICIKGTMPPRLAATNLGAIPEATWADPDLTPGSGTVSLFAWAGDHWTLSDETLTVYNASDSEIPEDSVVELLWIDGKPVASSPAGDAAGGASARCACPDSYYELNVECGACVGYKTQDPCSEDLIDHPSVMPRKMVVKTGAVTSNPDHPCDDCPDISNTKTEITNDGDIYSPTCTWSGQGAECQAWELSFTDTDAVLNLEGPGCVAGTWTVPIERFACCGTTTGWVAAEGNTCLIAGLSVAKHKCTCCPEKPAGPSPCTGTSPYKMPSILKWTDSQGTIGCAYVGETSPNVHLWKGYGTREVAPACGNSEGANPIDPVGVNCNNSESNCVGTRNEGTTATIPVEVEIVLNCTDNHCIWTLVSASLIAYVCDAGGCGDPVSLDPTGGAQVFAPDTGITSRYRHGIFGTTSFTTLTGDVEFGTIVGPNWTATYHEGTVGCSPKIFMYNPGWHSPDPNSRDLTVST